jgi:hypothetical protein
MAEPPFWLRDLANYIGKTPAFVLLRFLIFVVKVELYISVWGILINLFH